MTCELPLHLEGLSVPPPPNKEEDLLGFIGVSKLEIKLLLQKTNTLTSFLIIDNSLSITSESVHAIWQSFSPKWIHEVLHLETIRKSNKPSDHFEWGFTGLEMENKIDSCSHRLISGPPPYQLPMDTLW